MTPAGHLERKKEFNLSVCRVLQIAGKTGWIAMSW